MRLAELEAELEARRVKSALDVCSMERVSTDGAMRLAAANRRIVPAVEACKTGKMWLSSDRGGILVLGLHHLADDVVERFIRSSMGYKAHGNACIVTLDGQRGEIRQNAKRTCWIIDLARPAGILMAWQGTTRFGGPAINTSNSFGHWCGLLSLSIEVDAANPRTAAWLKDAAAELASSGMTPMQADVAANKAVRVRYEAESAWSDQLRLERLAREMERPEIERIMVDIDARIAEEIRVMAQLEAEQAEAVRQKNLEQTLTAVGVSMATWDAMTSKQQRATGWSFMSKSSEMAINLCRRIVRRAKRRQEISEANWAVIVAEATLAVEADNVERREKIEAVIRDNDLKKKQLGYIPKSKL
jgi:hypothetical protein